LTALRRAGAGGQATASFRPPAGVSGRGGVQRAARRGRGLRRKLREAGVDVTAARYEGILHDFVMLNDLAAPTRPPRRSIKRSVTCDGSCSADSATSPTSPIPLCGGGLLGGAPSHCDAHPGRLAIVSWWSPDLSPLGRMRAGDDRASRRSGHLTSRLPHSSLLCPSTVCGLKDHAIER
jgi:hypothetical protein